MVYDPDEVLEELEDELLAEEYEEEYDEDWDGEEEERPVSRRRRAPDIDWDEGNYDLPDAAFQPDPRAGMGKKLLVVLLDILVIWLVLRWCLGWK